jgi:hypothetical protein
MTGCERKHILSVLEQTNWVCVAERCSRETGTQKTHAPISDAEARNYVVKLAGSAK